MSAKTNGGSRGNGGDEKIWITEIQPRTTAMPCSQWLFVFVITSAKEMTDTCAARSFWGFSPYLKKTSIIVTCSQTTMKWITMKGQQPKKQVVDSIFPMCRHQFSAELMRATRKAKSTLTLFCSSRSSQELWQCTRAHTTLMQCSIKGPAK